MFFFPFGKKQGEVVGLDRKNEAGITYDLFARYHAV